MKLKETRESSERDVATSFGSRPPKTEDIYLDLLETHCLWPQILATGGGNHDACLMNLEQEICKIFRVKFWRGSHTLIAKGWN